MRNQLAFLPLMFFWQGCAFGFARQEKARLVEIDGVRHFLNPAIPANRHIFHPYFPQKILSDLRGIINRPLAATGLTPNATCR